MVAIRGTLTVDWVQNFRQLQRVFAELDLMRQPEIQL